MAIVSDQLAAREDQRGSDLLFAFIARDLLTKGYSCNPGALPAGLAEDLLLHLHNIEARQFSPAGIGREQHRKLDRYMRRDTISWITAESAAGRGWLEWTGQLQRALNRQLFLGLFSFESHFAHYAQGAFYRRHVDAFKGKSNRILSIVAYLNPGWQPADGGELVLYPDGDEASAVRVPPTLGTLVVFLSEGFEHEVLPSRRDRFSIAGWYRVNSSSTGRANPPV